MNKIPTIYDVAKEANVSPATVSRVMNHYPQVKRETSERVIAAMKRLNFHRNEKKSAPQLLDSPNTRKLFSNQPRIFLLSIPHIELPFSVDLIEGAQTAAQKNGHYLLINCTPVNRNNFDFFIHIMKSHHIAGVLTTEAIDAPDLLKINDHLPLVQCVKYNASVEQLSYISINDSCAVRFTTGKHGDTDQLASYSKPVSEATKKLYYEIGFRAFEQLLSEFLDPYTKKQHTLLKSEHIYR